MKRGKLETQVTLRAVIAVVFFTSVEVKWQTVKFVFLGHSSGQQQQQYRASSPQKTEIPVIAGINV